ncbi:MAG TPA: hypothetical protein VNE16_08750 [Vicinamibacterales bacterium]|nr:hypothetical protein [Vicinamibacterales bacterium]
MRMCVRRGVVLPVVAGMLALALTVGVAPSARAQTPFVPYFGKVYPHYHTFDWYIYTTDHFEIYYYPAEKPDLARIAGYAESAYQQISADLKHDLAFKVPLVIFKTHAQFEEQNIIPGGASEGVGAFSEPGHDRMVVPIDDPPDIVYGLITHELTHIFQFDIIPQSLIRHEIPLWVTEGQAEYERGRWSPLDLMEVRDVALTDTVPKMTKVENYGGFNNPRLVPYNLGHAVYEFIESRWGKEGIRQFMFALRKNVIGGGGDPYEDAFQMKPDAFDEAFSRYLKARFKPFRDLERPSDYGTDLAPKPDKTDFLGVLSIAPSPSGDLLAAIAPNYRDQEYDVILISALDGKVIRNLTPGFDKDMGWDHLSMDGERWNAIPYLSWSPGGDRLAYFVRKGPGRELIIENIVTGKIEQRIRIPGLDQPESPCFSPDGRHVVFSALNERLGDVYEIDLQTRRITDLTNDQFAEFAPIFSPDGKSIVYLTRVSGAYKLFQLDLATGKKRQLTFGTADESGAEFLNDHTLVFSSTATDPRKPEPPDVARNGRIYNIWTLDLQTGQLQQYTNTEGGNVSAVVLKTPETGGTPKVAFITYYKGQYGLHTIELNKPVLTANTSDFGAPGPIIDFQAPLAYTLIPGNIHKKGVFGKLFLEGRPPISVGVTSGGDVFGGTSVSFGDALGDHEVNLYAASVLQYRQLAASYVDLSHRFQYAAQAFSYTQFYYGLLGGALYDPALLLSRSQAQATQSVNGGSIYGIYPFDPDRRIQVSAGVEHLSQQYNDPTLQAQANQYQIQAYGRTLFNTGTLMPFDVSYIQETTVFRSFGPLSGNTMQLRYEVAPGLGGLLSRQTFDIDARYYMRIGASGLLALRGRVFKSFGNDPDFLYFGGNSEMHGYDYLQFIGQNAVFGDAELRFPIIEAALTPVGVLGGVRGVFFFNVGGAWWSNTGFKFFSSSPETVTPITSYGYDQNGNPVAIPGTPTTVSGFRLEDGRASYGIGLETFALGFPIHFDWSWRTLFNSSWENVVFASSGGSAAFRKPRFTVWIGYDF